MIQRHTLIRKSRALFALSFVMAAATPDVSGQDQNTAVSSADQVQETGGFFDIVFAGGAVGIVIVCVLLALSITAAYLIIDHVLTVRRADVMPDGLGDSVKQFLVNRQIKEAQQQCTEQPSTLASRP